MDTPTCMLGAETRRSLETVKLRMIGGDELPVGVQQLLTETEKRADGDLTKAVTCLRERLIVDSSIAAERAALVRWLVNCDTGSRLLRLGWRTDAHDPRVWYGPEVVTNNAN